VQLEDLSQAGGTTLLRRAWLHHVGLYLDPPERALVFCVDEKSQIQALDRSQPVLPMMPGVPERATHDYVRAGTTTLFAALEVATGRVIGSLHRRHRAEEFKKFLIKLDKEVPAGLDVHLICDNYATHKTPAIKKWLLAHPRFHLHFTPTGSSWLNLVERWFAELTNKQIRRGVHRSARRWRRTSAPGLPPGTPTRSPTSGRRPRTRSSNAPPVI
jgi:transposase